jgi:hypothetical protein
MSSIPIEVYGGFEEEYSLHLQGSIVKETTTKTNATLCLLLAIGIQFNSLSLCANTRATKAKYREINKNFKVKEKYRCKALTCIQDILLHIRCRTGINLK